MNITLSELTMAAVLAQADAAPEPWGRLTESMGLQAGSTAGILVVLVLLLTKAGCVAMSLWVYARTPELGQRILARYANQGRRCTVVGLVNGFVGLILALLMLKSKILALPGLLLLLLLGYAGVYAYGVVYRHLGLRLSGAPELAGHVSPRTHCLGGLAAEAAFCVPILGQILALLALFKGLGAVILAVLSSRRGDSREMPLP